MAEQNNPRRIFLCHASEDKPRVKELYHHLKAAGYHPWLDEEDLLPGQNWRDEIEKLIGDPHNMIVVCLSHNSVSKRGVVQQEIKWALDTLDQMPEDTIYLIPARLDRCAVPWRLSHLHWVDLFEPDGLAKLKRALDFELRAVPPESLVRYEQQYRERLKARFAEDAPYFIPLKGETTEVVAQAEVEAQAPRSARRRRQRALAEYHEWIQAGQEIKRVKLNTLREGVDKYDCIILLGEPGSGKTTALEHLAYELADEPDRLPLPLRLSEFGPGMSVEDLIIQSWAGTEQAGHWGMPELAANLEHYLEAGQLFILFDALNEMPHEEYQQRAQALRWFIDHWKANGNHFLVTCRVLDYGEELAGLQRIEIQPLNDEQIQALLQKELPQQWPALWQRLEVGQASKQRLLEMARNPYLLTMMVDIFVEDSQLGQNRAALMDRFTQILMGWAKAKCDPQKWLDAEVQREALSVMAFEMQDRAGSGTVVETNKIKTVMPETVQPDPLWPPRPASPDQVLKLAASAHIIEMPGDRSSVRFYHQLLQEYFAAWQMVKRNPANLKEYWQWPWLEAEMPLWERPEGNWDPLPPPPPTGWEETTILAASLVPENDDQLVQTLLEVNPILAGRCLHEGQAKIDQATRRQVIEALLLTIARPEVALRVRIAAGDVLGFLGDPRTGEMVTVPAGEFVMGSDPKKDKSAEKNEQPQHQLFLPEYQIGKYLLTNVEYERFIKAGGYQGKRWWTEVGWEEKKQRGWTEPGNWQDSRLNKPNQPVAAGVSWYECVAYCRWLSAETGQRYQLPTEAQWEKAARGVDGRVYPWGQEFDPGRLNGDLGEQPVRSTTPVGIYPTGVSPFSAFDCAGNVWEWCATKWGKSYPYDIKEDEWAAEYLDGTDRRVLRGGSWGLNQEDLARCAFRGFPYDKDAIRGFRVVVSPI